MALTKAQKEYLELKKETQNEINKLNGILEQKRKRLAKTCQHPEELHAPYIWEWDNGFGKQKLIEGVICSLCNAKKRWTESCLWDD